MISNRSYKAVQFKGTWLMQDAGTLSFNYVKLYEQADDDLRRK